jgi:hypothetical protein
MKMNLLDLISAKLELWRLEQRYTKRRNRRSTFVSDAVYVDGEYIYTTPSPSVSPAATTTLSMYSGTAAPKKHSSIVEFRSSGIQGASLESVAENDGTISFRDDKSGRHSLARRWNTARADKRRSMVAAREVKWESPRS